MGRTTTPPLPSVARVLAALGENVRLARLRRRIAASLLAERAGMSRATLRAIERGDGNVSMAAYANALHSLGLVADLGKVASDDELGRKLQDLALETKKRAPKRAPDAT
jgi:transcriptional regulator with XRE-family HTH domain